jgi:hypothetical protein
MREFSREQSPDSAHPRAASACSWEHDEPPQSTATALLVCRRTGSTTRTAPAGKTRQPVSLSLSSMRWTVLGRSHATKAVGQPCADDCSLGAEQQCDGRVQQPCWLLLIARCVGVKLVR